MYLCYECANTGNFNVIINDHLFILILNNLKRFKLFKVNVPINVSARLMASSVFFLIYTEKLPKTFFLAIILFFICKHFFFLLITIF